MTFITTDIQTECRSDIVNLNNSPKLQYYLLSPSNPPIEYVGLHDRAFSFWMNEIQKAFQEANNNDTSHLHDDFIRQDVLGCLCTEDEIVATFLHSFSSIYAQAARTFRYMKDNYPDLYFQQLKELGIRNVMTVHYLTVNPNWRRGSNGIQVAPIMIGLAQRIRDLYQLDALIGVYRRDRKVNEIAYSLGGECVISNVSNHQTPCDLIVMHSSKPYQYPSKEVGEQINSLWEQRTDTLTAAFVPGRKTA